MLVKPLTTIPQGSRVKRLEKQRVSCYEIVIWSDLRGDTQLRYATSVSRTQRCELCRTQMSWDVPVGGPFNIAGYALLLAMYCDIHGFEPGELVINAGDAHIYVDQIEGVEELLSREPFDLPELLISDNSYTSILDFKPTDFDVVGYQHHPHIKFPVAV